MKLKLIKIFKKTKIKDIVIERYSVSPYRSEVTGR